MFLPTLSHFHQLQVPSFTAATVLILNIWSSRLTGLSLDVAKEMEDIHKAMAIVKAHEARCDLHAPHSSLLISSEQAFFDILDGQMLSRRSALGYSCRAS